MLENMRNLGLGALLLFMAGPTWSMDVVRQETRTDAAVAAYGVSGEGVVIAILDRGIDWEHPDFRNPDGTTRIKWLIDMTGQNWCNLPNQPYEEYSEAEINAALSGGPTIPSRDAVGHGTVSAGLAAGNGLAAASGKYRGMAPAADLIIIKMTSDGAPAHDGEPAEDFFVACIDDALDILDAKLAELGNPPVVGLINSGTQWGPIDGTSAVSRKIDEIFGTDRPGRVYVSASGDEAWHDNHAGGDYAHTAPTVVRFFKSSPAATYMQMWYTGSLPASVTVKFDSGQSATVLPGQYVNNAGIELAQYEPGSEFYPWNSTSGDRAIWMFTSGPQGGGEIRITGLSPGTGRFDVYGDFYGVFRFTDHVVPGRLTDYSATLSAIVAGAHVARNFWTDIDGLPQQNTAEGLVHELWAGSSAGPTRDGRTHGVDLSAPGHNAFAAYAPNSWWATFSFNLIQDGQGWYGRGGATSGSAPIIVGAAALLLERNPLLTGAEVRQILRATARSDGFTGPVPNVDWGWGKLNMLAALGATPLPSGEVPDGLEPGESGLQIGKLGGDLALTWNGSCLDTDDDYVVYQGLLGDFTTHEPVTCSTSGATSAQFAIPSLDHYFLVAPRNAMREGSLGSGSNGPRPESASPCAPRQDLACPD